MYIITVIVLLNTDKSFDHEYELDLQCFGFDIIQL